MLLFKNKSPSKNERLAYSRIKLKLLSVLVKEDPSRILGRYHIELLIISCLAQYDFAQISSAIYNKAFIKQMNSTI